MISDTTPEAESIQHQIFARMTGDERVYAAMALSDQMRDIALAGLKKRYPNLGELDLLDFFIQEVHGVILKRDINKGQHEKPD